MVTSVSNTERRAVLELDGVQWATQKNVVEVALGRRPGVVAAEGNLVAQAVTVRYVPAPTTVRGASPAATTRWRCRSPRGSSHRRSDRHHRGRAGCRLLRPEIAAIMAGSSFQVAMNALTLKRLRPTRPGGASVGGGEPANSCSCRNAHRRPGLTCLRR